MLNIIRRQFVYHRAFLIGAAVVLCGFQFLLCAIVASIDLSGLFSQMMAFMPPIMRAMMEQSLGNGSQAGMLAFAWNHPVTHALAMAIPITFGTRAITGEIENGAIELILAQPLSRLRYFLAHFTFGMTSMLVIASVGVLGTIGGQAAFHLQLFGWDRLVRLLVNLLLLQVSVFALTLLLSSFGRETGRVAGLAVMVAIISFLINSVATLWSKAAFLKPYSLHSYYDPHSVLVDGYLPNSSIVILSVFAIVATAVAFARFLTRDLP
jgi:ABC-2 type transport system permease protein